MSGQSKTHAPTITNSTPGAITGIRTAKPAKAARFSSKTREPRASRIVQAEK